MSIAAISFAADDAFIKSVSAMQPEQQVKAVIAKLKELNPNFDGKSSHKIEAGAVVELAISTVGVTDLTPLGALSWLKKLTLMPWTANQKGLLSDLSPLKGLSLKALYCLNNPVRDLSPLAGMPLTELSIGGTQVSDLSPLTGMRLTVLGCNDTGVGDLKPLEGMPLTVLWCQNTRVGDLSALNGSPLQELRCDAAVAAQNVAILRGLKALAKINDTPAAAFLMRASINNPGLASSPVAPRSSTPAITKPAVAPSSTVGVGANQLKEMTIELGDGVKMEFILIPDGSFRMGSDKYQGDEKPVHNVTIIKPFHIGKYEVTQEQWENVMGNNPSRFRGAKNPVNNVSWDDCQKFTAKLNDKMRGQTFRLPSEAEWEYACRAGSRTDYCYGDATEKLGDYAWFKDNNEKKAHPVGQKKPNAWGLYDMHGNVLEWCQDAYHSTYKGAPTGGRAWLAGESQRIVRGGSLYQNATEVRSSTRRQYKPAIQDGSIGLRVVAEVRTP